MNKITIVNNSEVTIHGLKSRKFLKINADKNGCPLDEIWRRRMRDSKLDGAIIVMEEPKAIPKQKPESKKVPEPTKKNEILESKKEI